MKQRLLLVFVFCLFLLTWSSVTYQIFFNQQPSIIYATDAAKVLVNEDLKKELVIELASEHIVLGERYGEDLNEKVSKIQTEKNKNSKPSLDQGMDFGEGISIDDLLKNLGIAMND
ncbi:hypothetical protein RJD24_06645 [Bacillaceae bacterium IKA-2]|jgi:uncharacterized membrane protein|nr:hypothetical protein RJD24_06645 [Bacillaceae bacterium IKA-2]